MASSPTDLSESKAAAIAVQQNRTATDGRQGYVAPTGVGILPQGASFQVDDPKKIHEYLDRIVQTFPDKPIWMTELGYQSGEKHCGSSPAKQARFYHEVFQACDKHRDRLQMIMINWLHDQPGSQVEEWTKYYGLAAPAFAEFLATLGLRHADGTDKPAWKQIVAETQARGWD